MGLLSGSLSVTRFNVVVPPEGPDFERIQFWAIDPGSEVRERIGVIPFEIDAPYEVGQVGPPVLLSSCFVVRFSFAFPPPLEHEKERESLWGVR